MTQPLKNKQTITNKTFEIKFDLIDTPYEAVETIGSGAYGVVCSAISSKSKDKVKSFFYKHGF